MKVHSVADCGSMFSLVMENFHDLKRFLNNIPWVYWNYEVCGTLPRDSVTTCILFKPYGCVKTQELMGGKKGGFYR